MRKGRDGGTGGGELKKKKKGKKKEKTDENSGHYVIASSRPPERRPLERRTLAPIQKQQMTTLYLYNEKLELFSQVPACCENCKNGCL